MHGTVWRGNVKADGAERMKVKNQTDSGTGKIGRD